jgi:hypothetical protein
MKRRVSNLLAAASLVVCLGVAGLWVRSYFTRDLFLFGRAGGDGHVVQSLLGRVHWVTSFGFHSNAPGQFLHRSDRLSPQAIWNGGTSGYPVGVRRRLGFVWQDYDDYHADLHFGGSGFTTHHRLVVVPYWALCAPFAIAPVGWAVNRMRRRQRFGAGRCTKCGYDLRATPAKCPECGAAVSTGTAG